MHAALFEGQDQWSGQQNAERLFQDLAGDLGLDEAQFSACLEEGKYADKVTADYQEGVAEGVTGTPAFRINGAPLSGALPFADFQQQIDYYLAGGQPPSLEIEADSFRSLGDADAPVVVTEFSDYQCPACASVEAQVIPELIARYVDTGKARFVYREFPLESIHPAAKAASVAAVCAGQQGEYWQMHEKLFASQQEWSAADADPSSFFEAYAEEIGLDAQAFTACLDSPEANVIVRGDQVAGESLGVNATPYFFINDLPIRGGLPVEALGRIIDYAAAGGPTPEILPEDGDWHVRGNPQTAQAISVAFVDYASPESGDHARDVLPQLMAEYVDSGQLLYVLHPWADTDDSPSAQAAIAAECAGEQDKYWEMHEELFAEQDAWVTAAEPASVIDGYAESLDLDMEQFQTCLDSDWAKLRVQAGSVVGAIYGVPGAPVFLFNNGQGEQGSPTFEEFQTVIDSILNR
jgi:protein-disulfide isomerase